VDAIIKSYFPHIMFFGTLLVVLLLIVITYHLVEQKRRLSGIARDFVEFSVAVESLIAKIGPLVQERLATLENTKECPQCKKLIDEAYGSCPFCSHQFVKKYFVSVIGPGDEKTLEMAADKLSVALKIDFHEMKHRLRMGFDYAIPDHAKRHEFMTAVEKMGCTVKETLKWV
jgi:RNA polymerase subunit RPABC4/transcription elongation factor Spt4